MRFSDHTQIQERSMAAMAVSLPDDVVLEILIRVKDVPAVLFRFAMVCKQWRRLVADLSFLRRRWPESEKSFIGFTTRERLDGNGTKGLIPVPGSDLGRGLRALSSFVPALPAGAVPLVSRHGLLLVRLDSNPTAVQLAVCNLHVGTCHVLPPLSSRYLFNHEPEVNCYAVLTAADCRSDDPDTNPPQSHSFFKVVIIGYHKGDRKYHLYTLSSHQTRWSVRVDCFGSTALGYAAMAMGLYSDVVVRRSGTAHWFFGSWADQRFYVAKLNTQTEHISLTKLPFRLSSVPTDHYYIGRQCFALADDKAPSLLRMQGTDPLIEIRGQQGDQQNVGGTSEWLCTRMIKLNQLGKETRRSGLSLLGEKSGTLLVTDSGQRRVYTADLETGAMRRVVDWPRERYIKPGEVVPLEIDWAALFVSRLGTRESRVRLSVFVRSKNAPKTRDSRQCRRRRQEVAAAWHGRR